MEGHQYIPGDTTFSIHRTDLFPYIYLSKPLMKIAGFELRGYLVYRRSIRRPSYDQLNPFRRYVDEFLTETVILPFDRSSPTTMNLISV